MEIAGYSSSIVLVEAGLAGGVGTCLEEAKTMCDLARVRQNTLLFDTFHRLLRYYGCQSERIYCCGEKRFDNNVCQFRRDIN